MAKPPLRFGVAHDFRCPPGSPYTLQDVYAQTLGSIFTTDPKPLEVELTVAEVAASQPEDEIYRISYDGSVADVPGYVAMGGQADQIASALGERWREDLSLSEALSLAVELLGRDAAGGPPTDGTRVASIALIARPLPAARRSPLRRPR